MGPRRETAPRIVADAPALCGQKHFFNRAFLSLFEGTIASSDGTDKIAYCVLRFRCQSAARKGIKQMIFSRFTHINESAAPTVLFWILAHPVLSTFFIYLWRLQCLKCHC